MPEEPYRPPAEVFAVEQRKELRRNPLVAAFLSLIVPGAGQLYTGRLALGLALWAVFFASFLVLQSGLLADRPWLFIALLVVCLLLLLGSLVEATVVANRRRRIPSRRSARWFVLAPILVLLFFAHALLPKDHWADVPTGAMKPTILPGERVLIDPARYERHRPLRGDLAVFLNPADSKRQLKRVIALGGERVEMRGWRAVVDGDAKLDRWSFPSAANLPAPDGGLRAVVPEGHLFVLGDHRDNSRDSRVYGWISEDLLLGRAESIVFSPDAKRIGRRLHD